eukprot:CAMPEP_0117538606 /NCGR_PEP_ID=MMETSP0784-20121206/42564_1 /TAXON_ID=39447 /ORGANISM="" /LENGTH=291 /DNA_ID=CAMNT_0005335223 /DNA_START=3 /DNA_END=878 /DNA_ORIENTATION=+
MTALLLLALVPAGASALQAVLHNAFAEAVTIYWEPPDGGERVEVDEVPPDGGEVNLNTQHGHTFSFDIAGRRGFVTVYEHAPFAVLSGSKVRVRCSSTAGGGTAHGQAFDIIVRPTWSPRGAARFLQLVRDRYFDGCALNRVVKGFLTQFGIGANYSERVGWRTRSIPDDAPQSIPFRPGYLSYAGSGPDSRATEMFVVMPDAPQTQLDHFGTNSWETPFGYIDGDVAQSPVPRWHAYGDMPPWGKGPDPQKIFAPDGYEYLRRDFPQLDYLERCYLAPDAHEDVPNKDDL